ncbi:putative multidrug resistance protein [Planoprotostelium fungivorum]|uniref:Putative multidrug resistance protein n=1 Tax=Planoprotostelium fungivorum TaxID=1890364 RepID=A0A2P6N1A1_9EUKA|nr:putative multidrug resistance protein [Planoprotostelium fungivorum]
MSALSVHLQLTRSTFSQLHNCSRVKLRERSAWLLIEGKKSPGTMISAACGHISIFEFQRINSLQHYRPRELNENLLNSSSEFFFRILLHRKDERDKYEGVGMSPHHYLRIPSADACDALLRLLFGVACTALVIISIHRYVNIRHINRRTIPHHKWQVVKILFITIITAEYERGLENGTFVCVYLLAIFMLYCIQLQAILAWFRRGRDDEDHIFDLVIAAACTFFSGVLAILATFFNEKPETGYTEIVNEQHHSSPEDTENTSEREVVLESNVLHRLLFTYINPLLDLGRKRALQLKDLPPLHQHLTSKDISRIFTSHWNEETKREEPSIWRALFRSFGFRFVTAGLLKLAHAAVQFIGPVMLGKIVSFIQEQGKNSDSQQTYVGLGLVAVLSGSMLLGSILQNQYAYLIHNLGIQVHTAITNIVYHKCFHLSSKSRQSSSIGSMVNLQSIDAEKFEQLMPYLHMMWISPIEMIVAMVLLYNQLGWAAMAGLAVMVVLIPVNVYLAHYLTRVFDELMELRDSRTEKMNEILNGIRIIKFFAWEDSYSRQIGTIREKEMEVIRKSIFISATSTLLWSAASLFVSAVTFSVYTFTGHTLTAGVAFSSLALFDILGTSLNMIPNLATFVAEVKVSAERLVKYLKSNEIDPEAVELNEHAQSSTTVSLHGSWNWDESKMPPTLSDVVFQCNRGQLVCIVGPVGSGKTSVLSAILGEIPKLKGRVCVHGSKAYVAQQAWMQNATLRDNILFGNVYDEERYDRVLQVCELKNDIATLPHGDSTEIGEKGINLSGGQKQRVSLARAVYADRDIYLLDDCLSAVDAHVGESIFQNCIVGHLKHKTRILVTHQLQFVHRADLILGELIQQGTYTELKEKDGPFKDLIENHVVGTQSDSSKRLKKEPDEESDGKLMTDEAREVGRVDWKVWKIYFSSMGLFLLPLIIFILQVSEEGGKVGSDIWLSHWSSQISNDLHSPLYYLRIYIALSLSSSLLLFVRVYMTERACLKASQKLHDSVLNRVLRAPMSFFDTTPIGRVLNVFSSDINTLDDSIPGTLTYFMSDLAKTISSLIVVIFVIPPFLTVVLPLVYVYRYIQSHFLHSSRELKRIESITRSPIYAQFSETLAGLNTIRPYERREEFIDINHGKMDDHNRAVYIDQVSNRWMGLRLDFIGALVVTISTVFTVIEREEMDPGFVGLMLSYGLSLTQIMSSLIESATSTETEMVSVERIEGYSRIESEETIVDGGQRPPHDWPSEGVIRFEDVNLRYRPGLDLVLKGINVNIRSREKIGVVGRTGAGKSSLMLALYRFVELDSGRIIIDGLDIAKTNIVELRKRLSIIPQDPTLFTGTIRSNLDPFEEYSDASIWSSLHSVQLHDDVNAMDEKLSALVVEGGENFSVGQRQLLCLARAILRKPKILIMDEATAAVDYETDSKIQKTIRSEFKDTTVLTIAHRIHTISDYDRILVLDSGTVAELDTPQSLLSNKNSIFSSLSNTPESN